MLPFGVVNDGSIGCHLRADGEVLNATLISAGTHGLQLTSERQKAGVVSRHAHGCEVERRQADRDGIGILQTGADIFHVRQLVGGKLLGERGDVRVGKVDLRSTAYRARVRAHKSCWNAAACGDVVVESSLKVFEVQRELQHVFKGWRRSRFRIDADDASASCEADGCCCSRGKTGCLQKAPPVQLLSLALHGGKQTVLLPDFLRLNQHLFLPSLGSSFLDRLQLPFAAPQLRLIWAGLLRWSE